MKKLFPLLILLLVILIGCMSDRKERPGFFDSLGPVYWEGEIDIAEDHIVPMDALIIEKNTRVNFLNDVILFVYGDLIIKGTQSEPVIFHGAGKVILVSGSTNSSMAWCSMKESVFATSSDIDVGFSSIKQFELWESASLRMTNCRIGHLVCNNDSVADVSRSYFDRAGFYSDMLTKVITVNDHSVTWITNNWFAGNSSLGNKMTNHTILHYSSGNGHYERNWWATNDSTYVTNRLLFSTISLYVAFQPIAVFQPSYSLPFFP